MSLLFVVHFSVVCLASFSSVPGRRPVAIEFSLLSLQMEKGGATEDNRGKSLGERMSETLLWNISAWALWNNPSLVFSGEMKRNRLCCKQVISLLNPCSV